MSQKKNSETLIFLDKNLILCLTKIRLGIIVKTGRLTEEIKAMEAIKRLPMKQKLEETGFECTRSAWIGGNFRDYWTDGDISLEYRSETGLLHGQRNGSEYVWEFDAEQNEFFELVD
jgi:hypothetical protein